MKKKNKLKLIVGLSLVTLLFAVACENPWVPRLLPGGNNPPAQEPPLEQPSDTPPETPPVHEHEWGEWVVTTSATCTAAGVETRICTREGCKETRSIDALGGHIWPDDWVITPATCEEAGVQTRVCTRDCCEEYEAEVIAEALGHDWSNWQVTQSPTRTVEGEEIRECLRDGCTAEAERREIRAMEGFFFDMVWIPAGTFTRGQAGVATPEHEVTLTQGFFMGIHEVTQEQWRYVMTGNRNNISASPSTFTGDRLPVERVSWYHILVFANRLSIARGLLPAYRINGSTNPDDWGNVPTSVNATWDAVEMVIGATGYRLPTEAQWEYAARAGTTTYWSFGDTANGDYMWYDGNSGSRTQEVGTRLPNPWGLYDMHGNVWELVWDRYGAYTATPQIDPLGASSGSFRVRRGGGWTVTAQLLRSAQRSGVNPGGLRGNFLGFRVVRP